MSQPLLKPTEVLPGRGGREFRRHDTRGSSRLRPGHQTFFSRLQSFFPSSAYPSPRASAVHVPVPTEIGPMSEISSRPPPRLLKIRIVSWNMHNSLPKGNLEDLLGAVPPYVPCPESESDKLRLPGMSTEDGHPYHLIVVAGQECPTSSGIPMGLGASFRHKEKDRTKDSEKPSKKTKCREIKEKDKDEGVDQNESSADNLPSTPASDAPPAPNSHGTTSGWSWILEEWFCHGLGQRNESTGTASASELYDSQAMSASVDQDGRSSSQPDCGDQQTNDASCTNGKEKKKDVEKKRKGTCKDSARIGPYELLVKERLMGIYMAIFIYRDVKPLVRGISKSSVSTGLIGGRVGNKGGVGISLNIDGTTLLFINAHLAAHEERVMSRVANFAKIKSELQVNDFLSQDDPRVMSEDLTDKFDYTFLFGDLNFRLDVTRLHADWLISRQDYDQALSFDQLRTLMKNGEAFVGFNEAPIHFPPTFKYDVMKSMKRDRSRSSRDLGRMLSSKRWMGGRSNQNLSEVQETEVELCARLADEERGGSIDVEEDNGSFVSTAVTATSMQSRSALNGDPADSDGLRARFNSPRLQNKYKDEDIIISSSAVQKLLAAKAVIKAKAKWLLLLQYSPPRPPAIRTVSKASQRSSFSASFPQLRSRAVSSGSTSSALRAASAIELNRPSGPSIRELRRTSSRKSVKSSKSTKALSKTKNVEKSQQESEAGVYDTSSKQRVPSWCDRILWKTTIRLEPDSEDEDEPALQSLRNSGLGPRMLAFLTHALRPLSRTRTMSLSSLPSVSTVETPTPLPAKAVSRPATARSDSRPLMTQTSLESEKESALLKVKSLAKRKTRTLKNLKSKSIEPTSTTPLMSSMRKRRSRAYTAMPVISAPVVTLQEMEDATLVQEPGTAEVPSVPLKDNVARHRTTSTRGWLRLPFFNRETEMEPLASQVSLNSPKKQEVVQSKPRRPRRGEVVALSYNSLDDQAMRRLEGRSDHRPVIASYITYI